MKKITEQLYLSNTKDIMQLNKQLQTAWRDMAQVLNALVEGRIYVRYTDTAAPTTREWMVGDIVWNSAAAEAGGAGSKYVIMGWVCTTSGEPGTWKEMRVLTGS